MVVVVCQGVYAVDWRASQLRSLRDRSRAPDVFSVALLPPATTSLHVLLRSRSGHPLHAQHSQAHSISILGIVSASLVLSPQLDKVGNSTPQIDCSRRVLKR